MKCFENCFIYILSFINYLFITMFRRKTDKKLGGMGGGSRPKETKAEKEAKQKQKTLANMKKKGDVNELQMVCTPSAPPPSLATLQP